MRNFLTILLCGLFGVSSAQDTLSLDTALSWIRAHHPVVRALQYRMEGAEGGIMAARGAFDPVLQGEWGEKDFEDTDYYNYQTVGLRLPTWLGVDLVARQSFADGQYLNPERNVPAEGLWSAGVDVPIGGRLIWDERRAMLRDARLILQRTEAEQQVALNDVIYEAYSRYIDWAQYQSEMLIYREVEALAEERFKWVRRAYQAGDRRAIDTVEARIQWFSRKLKREEAEAKATKARAYLSAMMWTSSELPLEIGSNVYPKLDILDFALPMDSVALFNGLANQPQVAALTVEVDRMMNMRRWRRAQLWPDISVQYNFLRGGDANAQWNVPDQYQWGLKVSIPLLLRKSRGAARAADSRYREAEMKRIDAVQKAEAELFGLYAESSMLARQWQQAQELYVMSQNLLTAERRRFRIGESSVFLVNARENTMVESAIQWLKIRALYRLTLEKQRRLIGAYSNP